MENDRDENSSEPVPKGLEWLRAVGVLADDNTQLSDLVAGVQSKWVKEMRLRGYAQHQSGQYSEAIETFENANYFEGELKESKNIIKRLNAKKKSSEGHRRSIFARDKKLVVVSNRPLFAPVVVSRPKIIGTSEDSIVYKKLPAEKRSILSQDPPEGSCNFFVREYKADSNAKRKNRVQTRDMKALPKDRKKLATERPKPPNLFVVNATSLSGRPSSKLGKLQQPSRTQPKYRRVPPSAVNKNGIVGGMKSPLKKRSKFHSKIRQEQNRAKITGMREMRIPIVQTIAEESSKILDHEDSIILPTR